MTSRKKQHGGRTEMLNDKLITAPGHTLIFPVASMPIQLITGAYRLITLAQSPIALASTRSRAAAGTDARADLVSPMKGNGQSA